MASERISSPRQADERGAPSELNRLPEFASLPEQTVLGSIWASLTVFLSGQASAPKNQDYAYAPLFRSAHLEIKFKGRPLLASSLLHIGMIVCLVALPPLPRPAAQRPAPEKLSQEYKILWYHQADLLPHVAPPATRPAPKHARTRKAAKRAASKDKPAFAPVQVIISRPPQPDNARQTIIEPEAPPNLRIASPVEVPNIIVWQGVLVPPRPAVSEATRQLAKLEVPRMPAPVVAPPPPPELPNPPEMNRRNVRIAAVPRSVLPGLSVPPPPLPRPPKLSRQSRIQMAAVPAAAVPKLAVPPPPLPTAPKLEQNASEVQIAKLAVPDVLNSPAPPPPPAPKMPAVPALPARLPDISQPLPKLIAVGIAPGPPGKQIKVPQGNRAGEFAVSPAGAKNTGGEPAAAGKQAEKALEALAEGDFDRELSPDLNAIPVPHLAITGGNVPGPPPPVVATPAEPRPATPASPAAKGQLARLIASVERPALLPDMPSRGQPLDTAYFGAKRVYTLAINMPNLTSGSGSWILQFAELNAESSGSDDGQDISSPVAVRKVDPRYTPSAIREGVEGTVTLSARILRDGTVSHVRVLHSLDPRLDASAVQALSAWKFIPATKDGVPVDLEVVVQIPFRLPQS